MANIIDAPRTQLDSTVRLLDNFYNFDLVVDANKYDIVHSFFYEMTGHGDTADNFTLLIFRIATFSGENPIDILNYLVGKTKLEVNTLLAFYLNSLKSKTSLYGVSTIPQPNKNVQRNIVL